MFLYICIYIYIYIYIFIQYSFVGTVKFNDYFLPAFERPLGSQKNWVFQNPREHHEHTRPLREHREQITERKCTLRH